MQADFLEFLKRGRLAGVSIGMRRSAVVRHWGVPTYWSGKKSGRAMGDARYWYYGGLKCFFEKNLVLGMNFGVSGLVIQGVEWINYFARPMESLKDFCRSLEEHGIGYKHLTNRDDMPVLDASLLTEGGVYAIVRKQVDTTVQPDGSLVTKYSDPVLDVLVLIVHVEQILKLAMNQQKLIDP